MNKREANKLRHGDRIIYIGRVDSKYPDVEPHIGCGGRIIHAGGDHPMDSDGDLRIVWDDHAYNDQAYPPDNDRSWLYCSFRCVEREPQINVNDINEVEAFLNG